MKYPEQFGAAPEGEPTEPTAESPFNGFTTAADPERNPGYTFAKPMTVETPLGTAVFATEVRAPHDGEVRPLNGDAVAFRSDGDSVYFRIIDGAGGHGKTGTDHGAALIAQEVTERAFKSGIVDNDKIDALTSQRLAQDLPDGKLVYVGGQIWNGKFYPVQRGDAGAMVLDERGSLVFQTVPEETTAADVEANPLRKLGGVTNVVSAGGSGKTTYGPAVPLHDGYTIVAGSDVIFDDLEAGEVAECCVGKSPADAVAAMYRILRERMGQGREDDRTVLVFRVQSKHERKV